MPVLDLQHSLDELADAFAFSNDELARTLGTAPITVKRWHAGNTLPQGEARKRLDALWDLKDRLNG